MRERHGGGEVLVANRAAFLKRHPRRLWSLAGLAAVFGGWEVVGRLGLVPPMFLPPFSQVVAAGLEMMKTGELFRHLFASLWRVAWGFGLGGGLGFVFGGLLGASARADGLFRPLLTGAYPIPKIALLPLLILWLGLGEASKIAVIGLGVFFPMVINVRAGVLNVEPLFIRAALSLGSSRWRVFRKVVLPAALPMIFAGLRLGVGVGLLLVVTAEMVAADRGVGFLVLQAADLMQTPKLMCGILVLSVLGWFCNWALDRLERLCIPWKERG